MSTVNGHSYFPTVNGHNYLPTANGHNYLPTVNGHSYFPTVNGLNYLPTVNGRNYLPTVNVHNYLPTVSGHHYLPSIKGHNYLPTVKRMIHMKCYDVFFNQSKKKKIIIIKCCALQTLLGTVTHLCLASHNRDTGKQCRMWHLIRVYSVCINYSNFYKKHSNNKKKADTSSTGNGLFQRVVVEESTWHKWIQVNMVKNQFSECWMRLTNTTCGATFRPWWPLCQQTVHITRNLTRVYQWL